MKQIGLITVTHDPIGRNVALFQELQAQFEGIYSDMYITISDETSQEMVTTLVNSKFHTKDIPKTGAANARRESVKLGLSGGCNYFHYCDFDRLLTWGKNNMNELKEVVASIPNHPYYIFGRTERAFQTHPIEWMETEKITNRICSMELDQEVDITAGSCSFSRESAELINEHSKEKMTDAEWAMIVHRIGQREVSYRSVEGLEYHEVVNSSNQKLSTSEAWLSRLKLSLIISETACRIGK